MELMGHRDRDGHSGAWALAQPGERAPCLADLAVGLPRRPSCRRRDGSGSRPDRRAPRSRWAARPSKTATRGRRAARAARQRVQPPRQPADVPDRARDPRCARAARTRRSGPHLRAPRRLARASCVRTRWPCRRSSQWVTGAYGTRLPDRTPARRRWPAVPPATATSAFWSETLTRPGRDLRRLQRGPGTTRRATRSAVSRPTSSRPRAARARSAVRHRPAQQPGRRQHHVRPPSRRSRDDGPRTARPRLDHRRSFDVLGRGQLHHGPPGRAGAEPGCGWSARRRVAA